MRFDKGIPIKDTNGAIFASQCRFCTPTVDSGDHSFNLTL